MFFYIKNGDASYYCLLEKNFDNSKKIKIKIKGCNYFSIKITSFNSNDIIDNINKWIKEYIKSLNYKLLDMPIIEVYYDDKETINR